MKIINSLEVKQYQVTVVHILLNDHDQYIWQIPLACSLLLVLKILEVKISRRPEILVNYITLLMIKYLKIHNFLYPQ